MILSEILESLCVEIIDTTRYMNNLYLRDFLYGFNPFDLSNLSHCILTTLRYQYQLLCSVQRGVDELSVPLIKLSFSSFNIFGIFSCQVAAYLDYFTPCIYQMIQISGEKTVHIIRYVQDRDNVSLRTQQKIRQLCSIVYFSRSSAILTFFLYLNI